MPFQPAQFLAGSPVPKVDKFVFASPSQSLPIGGKSDGVDPDLTSVPLDAVKFLARRRFPETNVAVITPGGQHLAVMR